MAQTSETEKIKYKCFSMRLDDRTIELLKMRKENSCKSWNRYIYGLIKEDNNKPDKKTNYLRKI